MKFLLICPTAPCWRVEENRTASRRTRIFRFSQLTALSVTAALPPHVKARIMDEDVEPIDYDADCDLVGISFMTYNAPRAYEIADRFHKEKGKTVIFGGYHPTFMTEEAGRHCDSVCVGEAETNLPRMIADFEGGQLQPVYRSEPAELKGLRVPERTLLKKSAYGMPDAVQATRGCPNHCRFCSVAPFFRHTFRTRPVPEVIAELGELGRFILFMDDSIIADPDYARELFAAMIPLRKTWVSQCGVGIAQDPELLGLAVASGCRGLFIGLESINQTTLRSWGKGFNRAREYERAIGRIHAAGVAVFGAVVFGADSDSADVFGRTLDFLAAARVDVLQATILTPFPGTPLYHDLDRQGRIFDRDWSHYDFGHVVFEPANMSRAELRHGHDWVLAQFYSQRNIWRRIAHSFGRIPATMVLRGVMPLNLGYRYRLAANRAIRRVPDFEPGRAAARTRVAGMRRSRVAPTECSSSDRIPVSDVQEVMIQR